MQDKLFNPESNKCIQECIYYLLLLIRDLYKKIEIKPWLKQEEYKEEEKKKLLDTYTELTKIENNINTIKEIFVKRLTILQKNNIKNKEPKCPAETRGVNCLDEYKCDKNPEQAQKCWENKDKTLCPYCDEVSDSSDPNVLCKDCRELFGHTFIHEL